MRCRPLIVAMLGLFATVAAKHCAADEPRPFVGAATCSTFGCHGNFKSDEPWRSAYSVWSRYDPHAHAAEGLLGDRGLLMLRKLIATESKAAVVQAAPEPFASPSTPTNDRTESSPAPLTSASEEALIVKMISDRCIACHATPAASDRRVREGANSHDTTANTIRSLRANHMAGVSCESCHGAAGGWLAEHATSRWASVPAEKKASEWGFQDTADLYNRAAICVECHVGPKRDEQQRVFRVDHDLIAAGHPRLSFEFASFLRNLPAHWDVKKDHRRVGPDSYQLTAWRFGNWQHVRALARDSQIQASAPLHSDEAAQIDFAQYDCFRCHHQLAGRAAPARPRRAADPGREGFPPAEDAAIVQLEWTVREDSSQRATSLVEPLNDFRRWLQRRWGSTASRDANTESLPPTRLVEALDTVESTWRREPWTVADQCRTLTALAREQESASPPRWESAVQLHLAVAALVEDRQGSASKSFSLLKRCNEQLGELLTEAAGGKGRNSIYQSPLRFIREEAAYRSRVTDLVEALEAYHTELVATPNTPASPTP